MDNRHAVREMRRAILELSIKVATGELLDIERVTSSSERGGWKRAEFQYLVGRLLYCKSGSEGSSVKPNMATCQGARFLPYPDHPDP